MAGDNDISGGGKVSGSGVCEKSIWYFCRQSEEKRHNESLYFWNHPQGCDFASDGYVGAKRTCDLCGKGEHGSNCPDYLREESAEESGIQTVEWIKDVLHRKYQNTMPILTPRFTPSCSDELMENLKKIQMYYGIPVQSHLSENPGEIEWVKELCPWSAFYGDAYDQFGLFGADCRTVMAHCVYSGEGHG